MSIIKDAKVHVYNTYQQDEFTYAAEPFSNYEQRDDFVYDEYHEEYFEKGGDIFVSEKVVTPQHLTVDIRNKLSFLTYGHFQSFICSIFGQEIYL